MGEAVSAKQSGAGRNWLNITWRILIGVVLVVALLGLIVNLAGLIGTWAVRGPAYNNVSSVTGTLTNALGNTENGLTRVNTGVQSAQQAVTQVNKLAAQLGDKIQANSPIVDRLNQLVNTNLSPRIDNMRSSASTMHDAVITFNGALVVVNRLPGVSTPRLNNALASISQRVQDAQATVQDLRTTLVEIKAGIVAKAQAAVTQLTARISAALTQIQTVISKYQAQVTGTQTRVTSTGNTILTLINLLSVALTILFIVFAAGLVLLVFFCWQYVRHGRFPSLRARTTP